MKNKIPTIIGFAGLAGEGKTTSKDLLLAMLAEAGKEVIDLSFAGPLKTMLSTIVAKEFLSNPTWKNDPECGMLGKSPRELMQTLGTEWGRNMVHTDLWVHLMEEDIRRNWSHVDFVLIDDARFENEFTWVAKHGRLVLVSTGLTRQAVQHESEQLQGLHSVYPKVRILINDMTREGLFYRVKGLCEAILHQSKIEKELS